MLRTIGSIHTYQLMNCVDFRLYREKCNFNEPADLQINRIKERQRQPGCENVQVAISRIMFMAMTKPGWSESKFTLIEILQHSRNRKCSDDRDHVYSMLGMTESKYAITPDYSKENSTEKVFIEATAKSIQIDVNLETFAYVTATKELRRRALPSWVVDWHDWSAPKLPSISLNYVSMIDHIFGSYSKQPKAEATISSGGKSGDMALEVRGLRVV